ncbi:MAG TPA: porin [Gemmataceae bacterium]|nr:porin [Gemmataceae bacterium]
MKRIGAHAAVILALAGAAHAADVSPGDIMVTKAPSPAAATAPAACGSLWDFIVTSCPLSWYGITVYGVVDAGVTWQSHGTPFNRTYVAGEEYLISKNSNRALWGLAPNALSQSNIGIKGNKEFAPGWSFVFDLQAGFDPYSLRLADGPGSVAQNAGVPLISQNSNADSSRAGQFYNSVGYVCVSSLTYGTLTVFRQNSLTLDGIAAYDPMGGSYAFSVIGYQGIACGAGDTEDCRFSTSVKYRVNIGQLRAAALWQFGGYSQNNGSNGAYQFQIGGDIPNLANGMLSFDAIYSHVTDAVAIALAGNPLGPAGNPLPPWLPQVLTATISDDTSVMLLARYTNGPIKLYAGYVDSVRASERSPNVLYGHSWRSSLSWLCRHQQHEHQQHGLLHSPQDLADILDGGEIRRHRQLRFDRRLLSLQSRQLWRRRLLDRRQLDVQRDARRSFFRGRLEICGEVRCLRWVHVLASRQWAGERLPQSQHDRSDGRGSLPILRNPRAHVPDHATRSRRRGDRMNGLD